MYPRGSSAGKKAAASHQRYRISTCQRWDESVFSGRLCRKKVNLSAGEGGRKGLLCCAHFLRPPSDGGRLVKEQRPIRFEHKATTTTKRYYYLTLYRVPVLDTRSATLQGDVLYSYKRRAMVPPRETHTGAASPFTGRFGIGSDLASCLRAQRRRRRPLEPFFTLIRQYYVYPYGVRSTYTE
jgi:hypothetical protein